MTAERGYEGEVLRYTKTTQEVNTLPLEQKAQELKEVYEMLKIKQEKDAQARKKINAKLKIGDTFIGNVVRVGRKEIQIGIKKAIPGSYI